MHGWMQGVKKVLRSNDCKTRESVFYTKIIIIIVIPIAHRLVIVASFFHDTNLMIVRYELKGLENIDATSSPMPCPTHPRATPYV